MMKYYFQKHDENCYTIQYHLDYMREHEISKMTVFEAKREVGSEYFFCKEYFEIGEVGECGKHCSCYQPRNGKSGICKHYGYVYEQTSIKILTI